MQASNNGDLATVLSLMADDVVFMVPGREPFGKEAFAAMSRNMEGIKVNGSCDIREVQVIGNWAYVRNAISLTITPPAGKPVKRSGWTMSILQKQTNGRWLLVRDANLVTTIEDAV